MTESRDRLGKIKILLFDLDGVIILDSQNRKIDSRETEHLKSVLLRNKHRADEMGLRLGIISGSEDKELISIIKMAGIEDVFIDSLDKVSQAEKILFKYGLTFKEMAYIGDDMFDIPLLAKAGFSAAPLSARREVKRGVHYICRGADHKTALDEVMYLLEKQRTGL